jgi:hypothetical protein
MELRYLNSNPTPNLAETSNRKISGGRITKSNATISDAVRVDVHGMSASAVTSQSSPSSQSDKARENSLHASLKCLPMATAARKLARRSSM